MSLSPEGRRRLQQALRVCAHRALGLPDKLSNWPSRTTLSTNMLHRSLRGEQTYMFELSNQAPAARRSPARLKEAVSWWFARAETRRIIERMMQL